MANAMPVDMPTSAPRSTPTIKATMADKDKMVTRRLRARSRALFFDLGGRRLVTGSPLSS